MSRRVRCERVTLDDGSSALVRTWGQMTEADRRALNAFNDFLKCQDCTTREKCALSGCAEIELSEPSKGGND